MEDVFNFFLPNENKLKKIVLRAANLSKEEDQMLEFKYVTPWIKRF